MQRVAASGEALVEKDAQVINEVVAVTVLLLNLPQLVASLGCKFESENVDDSVITIDRKMLLTNW